MIFEFVGIRCGGGGGVSGIVSNEDSSFIENFRADQRGLPIFGRTIPRMSSLFLRYEWRSNKHNFTYHGCPGFPCPMGFQLLSFFRVNQANRAWGSLSTKTAAWVVLPSPTLFFRDPAHPPQPLGSIVVGIFHLPRYSLTAVRTHAKIFNENGAQRELQFWSHWLVTQVAFLRERHLHAERQRWWCTHLFLAKNGVRNKHLCRGRPAILAPV